MAVLQLTTEFVFILCLEILPDSQPHVGHGEFREMGGRSSGKDLSLSLYACLLLYVCLYNNCCTKFLKRALCI